MNRIISLLVFVHVFSFSSIAQVDRQAALNFNEGVLAYKENNFEGAIAAYGAALAIDKGYKKARYNRAKAFLKIKSYERAIGDLNEYIKLDAQSANAWKYKGYAYMQLKNYPGAIHSYNKLLEIDPSRDDSRANRAIALIREGKFKKSMEDLVIVHDNDPSNAVALYHLAICQSKLDQKDGALQSYEKLIDLSYKLEVVAKERAKLLIGKEKIEMAVQDLNKAIEADEADYESYYLRGYCHLKLEDINLANDDFAKSIQLNSRHVPSIQNKAFTSFKLGKYDEAVTDFSRLLEMNPGDTGTLLNRGLSRLKLEKYQSAYDDLSMVISTDPMHAVAYYNRASAAIGMNNSELACADMRSAAKLGYEDAFSHIRGVCDQ